MSNQVIDIDFHVSSDLYYLKVTDISLWALIEDKTSIIEIYTPGSSKPIKKYFDKKKTNVYSAYSLDSNCGPGKVELQDGIYTIQVTGSPSKYFRKRYYLKTDKFRSEMNSVIINSFEGNSSQRSDMDDIMTDIEFSLRGAHSYTEEGIILKAAEVYQQAVNRLEKMKNCKNCK